MAKHLLTEPRYAAWRDIASKYGFASLASLPLMSRGEVFGVLNVYAQEEEAFDLEETDLLQKLAGELSFAISSLRAKEAEGRTAAALRESEEKYRDLVESSNSIILRMDADGLLTFVNRYTQEFFGYPQGEMEGRSISMLLPIKDSAGVDMVEMVERIKQDPEAFKSIECEVVLHNGEVRWITWTNRPIRLPDGKLKEILSIGNDVTGQKRAAAELQRSRERFARVFDDSPIGIELFDVAGNMIESNPASLELFGLSSVDDLKSFNIFSDTLMGENIKSRLRQGESVKYEAVVDFSKVKHKTSKTGVMRVEMQGIVLRSAQGLDGYLFLLQDVTRRRQIEDILRRHSQEFRALSENAPDGITRYDRKMRHLYQNPAGEKIVGIPRETMIGKTDRELGFPDDLVETAERTLRRCFESAQEQHCEYSVSETSGVKHYDARLAPEFGADGSVESILMISHDVTAHKQLEEALKRAHEGLEEQVHMRTLELVETNRQLEREVGERKRRELELYDANRKTAESESRYRTIIESTLNCVTITQFGKIVYINPAGIKLYGAESAKELIGREAQDFIHPLHRTTSSERMARVHNIPTKEVMLVRLDGKTIHVESRGRWITYQGKPAILGMLRDVTERRENELRMLTNNFLLALRNDATSIKDYADGLARQMQKIVGSSYAGVSFFGAGNQAVESNINFPEKLWEMQTAFFQGNNESLRLTVTEGSVRIETGKPDALTRHVPRFLGKKLRKDKEKYYAELRRRGVLHAAAIPISYRENVLGMIHLADDAGSISREAIQLVESFTPLVREAIHEFSLESDLRDKSELMERVFSTTNVMLAYLDKDFNFIRVNNAYAAADGRMPEYFVGKNLIDLYPYEGTREILHQVVETGETYQAYAKPFEYAEHPERGVAYWDWIVQAVRDDSGKINGLLLCFVDVTERARMEEKLLESYKRLGVINRQVAILLDVNRQAGGRNNNKILKYIINSALNLSQAKIVSLYEYDQRKDCLGLVGSSDPSSEKEKGVHCIELANHSFLQPLVKKKVRVQGMFSKKVLRKLNISEEVKYFLFLPLMSGKKLWGSLLLGFAERDSIMTQELEFYEAFSAQASYAFHNLKTKNDRS